MVPTKLEMPTGVPVQGIASSLRASHCERSEALSFASFALLR